MTSAASLGHICISYVCVLYRNWAWHLGYSEYFHMACSSLNVVAYVAINDRSDWSFVCTADSERVSLPCVSCSVGSAHRIAQSARYSPPRGKHTVSHLPIK